MDVSLASPATGQAARLSTRIKLLFSTGDLSTSIPLAIVMFFQLYFLPCAVGRCAARRSPA